MPDSEDPTPSVGDTASDDGTTPMTRNRDEDVAQLVPGELARDEGPELTLDEPKKILGDALEDAEELSSVDGASVDAIPRRAGSPIDSVMSGPDDSPSVQVSRTGFLLCSWQPIDQSRVP